MTTTTLSSMGLLRKNPRILAVMGLSCSGKTSIIEESGLPYSRVGAVLRKKYGEEAFKGQGAPDEFEEEALALLRKQLEQLSFLHSTIVVDGQPRTLGQLEFLRSLDTIFVWNEVPSSVLRKRALQRKGRNARMALERIDNDKAMYGPVLQAIEDLGLPLISTSTLMETLHELKR